MYQIYCQDSQMLQKNVQIESRVRASSRRQSWITTQNKVANFMHGLIGAGKQTGHTTCRGRFTLIELLTVIAIIAILFALLFPTLRRAKAVVKSTVCMANQKQTFIALSNYISTYNNRFPPSYAEYEDINGNRATHADGYMYLVKKFGSGVGKEYEVEAWRDLYSCPEDNIPSANRASQMGADVYNKSDNQFYMNKWYSRIPGERNIDGDATYMTPSKTTSVPTLTMTRQPSKTVAHADGMYYWVRFESPSPVVYRHFSNIKLSAPYSSAGTYDVYRNVYKTARGFANFNFMDGHVESMNYKTFYERHHPYQPTGAPYTDLYFDYRKNNDYNVYGYDYP